MISSLNFFPLQANELSAELFPRIQSPSMKARLDWLATYGKSRGWKPIDRNTVRLMVQPSGYISEAYEVALESGKVTVYPGTHDEGMAWTFFLTEKAKTDLQTLLNSKEFNLIPQTTRKAGRDGSTCFLEFDIKGNYGWFLHWAPDDPRIESVFKMIGYERERAAAANRALRGD